MRYFLFFIFSLFVLAPASAQDPGIRFSAGVDKKFGKKFEVGVEAEYRGKQGLSQTERMSIGVSGEYKPLKYLKFGLGYEYLHNREQGGYSSSGNYYNSSYWYPRHRINVDVTGQVKLFKRLSLSLRERWVYTNRPEFERNRMAVNEKLADYGEISSKTVKAYNRQVLRSRLMAEYNIKKCPFTPFVSTEIYNSWNVEKVKYSIGTDIKLQKHHTLKVYYMYQDYHGQDDDEPDKSHHIIGAGYKFTF